MKTMTLPIAVAAFAAAFAAEETCKDGICPLPASPAEAEFAVLSPVPETAVETVKQGPRLRSLEGKTIALVGGSFMASVTHSELKNLILKEFPTAKVYLLNEIGSAGAYPRPDRVVLPAKWDALMAEKGYEPLEKFTLKSDMRPDVPKPKVRGYDRPGVRADVGPGMRRPQATRR